MHDLAFSPWYINTRRIAHATGTDLGTHAERSVADNSIWRVDAMHAALRLAQQIVANHKIPTLTECIAAQSFPGSVVASTWANMSFSGTSAAFRDSERGRPVIKPRLSVQLPVNDGQCTLTGALEIEHYYSSSSVSYLSNKKQGFVAGQFELDDGATHGRVYPWLIGDLLEPIESISMSYAITARLYPSTIDAFQQMSSVRAPSEARLREIMSIIPEVQIKTAFAQIIGEPFISKDWGGEQSDLYSSRITIEGVPTSAAFLLKGPAVSGPMRVPHLGKNGDQIIRLFNEPADLLVVQHVNKIDPAVVQMLRLVAITPTNPRKYCIIDGADTYRILRAYDYIDETGAFTAK